MPTEPDHLAETAQAAVAAGDWVSAGSAFGALVAREPTAEAFAGLGDVLWWLGETDEAVRYQERAYAAFQHRGDPAGAGIVTVGLHLVYRVSLGNVAAARGWLARVARLVAESGLAPLEGWVALLRAHDSADPVAAARLATEARDLPARVGDSDLELCALSQLGASLVRQGRGAEGTLLLDEAMAASLAGESTRPHTVVYTSCTMISACAQTAELDHARMRRGGRPARRAAPGPGQARRRPSSGWRAARSSRPAPQSWPHWPPHAATSPRHGGSRSGARTPWRTRPPSRPTPTAPGSVPVWRRASSGSCWPG
ncbi:hypothetical protein R1X32_10675 (plasmid) [Rhodococcus opacus]|uniref:hypothetical protein n=1 Tax=Rhodococcus opacus TaxID=37919 RepID=UPI0034D224EE